MKFESAREIFEALPRKFSADAAGDLDAVFQFDILGDRPSQWCVTVAHGQCQVEETVHPAPAVTLTMAEDTWIGIVSGDISAFPAVMNGQIRARGNVLLAQRLGQVFGLAL